MAYRPLSFVHGAPAPGAPYADASRDRQCEVGARRRSIGEVMDWRGLARAALRPQSAATSWRKIVTKGDTVGHRHSVALCGAEGVNEAALLFGGNVGLSVAGAWECTDELVLATIGAEPGGGSGAAGDEHEGGGGGLGEGSAVEDDAANAGTEGGEAGAAGGDGAADDDGTAPPSVELKLFAGYEGGRSQEEAWPPSRWGATLTSTGAGYLLVGGWTGNPGWSSVLTWSLHMREAGPYWTSSVDQVAVEFLYGRAVSAIRVRTPPPQAHTLSPHTHTLSRADS